MEAPPTITLSKWMQTAETPLSIDSISFWEIAGTVALSMVAF